MPNGTRTFVQPNQVEADHPEYWQRRETSALIIPMAHVLVLNAVGRVSGLRDVNAQIRVVEDPRSVGVGAEMRFSGPQGSDEELYFGFGDQGQVQSVWGRGDYLPDVAGFRGEAYETTYIKHPADQQEILTNFMAELNHGNAQVVDLGRTAQGLYEKMETPDFDPTEALVFTTVA